MATEASTKVTHEESNSKVDVNHVELMVQGNGFMEEEKGAETTKLNIVSNPVHLRRMTGSVVFYNENLPPYTVTVTANSTFPTVKASSTAIPINTGGKWYYEATIHKGGLVQLGWATSFYSNPTEAHGKGIGDYPDSWSYDGSRRVTFHGGKHQRYAQETSWKAGDVVGCLYDGDKNELSFCLNGEDLGVAFTNVHFNGGISPAATMKNQETVTFNFGGSPFIGPPASYGENVHPIAEAAAYPSLETLSGGAALYGVPRMTASAISIFPTIRVKGLVVSKGRWYYEVTLRSSGICQIGWASAHHPISVEVEESGNGAGDQEGSWSFDGNRHIAFVCGQERQGYGLTTQWKAGDVIGSLLDTNTGDIRFSVNGTDLGIAATGITLVDETDGIYPAISIKQGEELYVNIGQEPFLHAPSNIGSLFSALSNFNTSLSLMGGKAEVLGNSLIHVYAHSIFPTVKVPNISLDRGKWYYEVTLKTGGVAQIGWADNSLHLTSESRGKGMGDYPGSFGFDGSRRTFFYNEHEKKYAETTTWVRGDVIGCMLDADSGEARYSINGTDMGVALSGFVVGEGFYPALSLKSGQAVVVNLGDAPFRYKPQSYDGVIAAKAPVPWTTVSGSIDFLTLFRTRIRASSTFPCILARTKLLPNTGKWYYEVTIEQGGVLQIGFADTEFSSPAEYRGRGIGDDVHSWSFDGSRESIFHADSRVEYGQKWKSGDVVGALFDSDALEIHYFLNGTSLGKAFQLSRGSIRALYPAISLQRDQVILYNFGSSDVEFKAKDAGKPIYSHPDFNTNTHDDPSLQNLQTTPDIKETPQIPEDIDENGVIRVQAMWRSAQSKKKLKESRNAAVKIQTAWRQHKNPVQEKEETAQATESTNKEDSPDNSFFSRFFSK